VISQPLDEKALRQRAEEAGQGHIFRFWGELPEDGRRHLLEQVAEVDFGELAHLVAEHVTEHRPVALPPNLEPAPFVPLPVTEGDRVERRRMRDRGEELLSQGKVAALVVAGGQGTRLGFEGPKGAFPIGPVSGRPLFAIFANAIQATRRAYGASVPWYIMTSLANDRATRDFFDAHNGFDLPVTDIRFFQQGMMPAVDLRGKLLLARRDELAWNPDGHGGTIRAVARRGMLEDMVERGIEHLSYFQVDNPLVSPLDPVFLGYHAETRADMSSKMARKRDPGEKLGVFCQSGGRLHVIEYSDLPASLAEARGADGALRFDAGSVAIHVLSQRFIERLTSGPRFALPFHRAEKKIPCVDESGRPVVPEKPNGVKFETFVFDALPLAERTVVLEVDRQREFSPVKNADGEDSPATARRDMVHQAARLLEEAGASVPRGQDGEPIHKIEINPVAARNPAELKALVARIRLHEVTRDLYIGPEDV
jgi:UDP-N-acetylglucosamine/UDP-N-acetylgalactosamine diphosphorylase